MDSTPHEKAREYHASGCPKCDAEMVGVTVEDLEQHIRDEHPDQIDPKGAAVIYTLGKGDPKSSDMYATENNLRDVDGCNEAHGE